ncbi:MAG: hypothetical protein KDC95_12445 [Planctomycetes bacterium]|nr:hypothetical protein [Planctomycetota bacterium]
MTKYLFKANDDVLSFCDCKDEPAMSTGQLDCPWCGCGWMIACSKCAKSYIFAEVRETDESLRDIGRRVLARQGYGDITDEELQEWCEHMEESLEDFDTGDVVVYLDGEYLRVDEKDVRFEGYYASHDLKELPHARALQNPAELKRILGDGEYWRQRALDQD